MTEALKERIRRRLKAKVAKRKQLPKATPPRYDDVYFKGLAIAAALRGFAKSDWKAFVILTQ